MAVDVSTDLTFELDSFVREGDVFVVAGRWRSKTARSLGRPKLAVVGEGKRRRLTSTGRAPAQAMPDGAAWQGRFRWAGAPEELESADLEIGSDLVELPLPKHAPTEARLRRFERDPEPAPTPDLVEEMRTLLDALREEREALAAEREALAQTARAPRVAAGVAPPVAVRKRESVDLGPWPQWIMAGGLATFVLLILVIALS